MSSRLHEWRGRYRGSATHKAKLTEADVVELRRKYRNGTSTRELAKHYRVNNTAVWYAVTKRPILRKCGRVEWRYYTWNHVPDHTAATQDAVAA